MIKLDIQRFGGRGASSSFKGGSTNPRTGTTYPNVNMTQSQFIKSVIAEENELTRGDLQGIVEAYAMENQLTPITEEKILQKIDSGINEYRIYKEAMGSPDKINAMTEMSTNWSALERKYGKIYRNSRRK